MTPVVVGWSLAFVLGARHASEPDHLAAVSTLLAEQPAGRRGAALGAFWGLGHTASLLACGGALLVLHARMPGRVADAFELVVAAMLVALGARSLLRSAGNFAGKTRARSPRPLAIGLVHGLAGSGALTALALADMPSLASGLVYMALFGVGSIGGMALLTGVASRPLRALAQRPSVRRALTAMAGTVSLALGAAWGWPVLRRLLHA